MRHVYNVHSYAIWTKLYEMMLVRLHIATCYVEKWVHNFIATFALIRDEWKW